MTMRGEPPRRDGQIVILNGAPRSGKSSIAAALQEDQDTIWINLGVDVSMGMTPAHLRPGIGLRPGGERPGLEPAIALLAAALFESMAAHARLGLNVVADLGLHESYASPLRLLEDAKHRLRGLSVLFVGIHCPLEVIMARRNAAPAGRYLAGDVVPAPVKLWQEAVRSMGPYDLELDTSGLTPTECALAIRAALASRRGPRRFPVSPA